MKGGVAGFFTEPAPGGGRVAVFLSAGKSLITGYRQFHQSQSGFSRFELHDRLSRLICE
jgi:hypothetical protein